MTTSRHNQHPLSLSVPVLTLVIPMTSVSAFWTSGALRVLEVSGGPCSQCVSFYG